MSEKTQQYRRDTFVIARDEDGVDWYSEDAGATWRLIQAQDPREAEIATLRAENTRLREALTNIAEMDDDPHEEGFVDEWTQASAFAEALQAAAKALQALKEK